MNETELEDTLLGYAVGDPSANADERALIECLARDPAALAVAYRTLRAEQLLNGGKVPARLDALLCAAAERAAVLDTTTAPAGATEPTPTANTPQAQDGWARKLWRELVERTRWQLALGGGLVLASLAWLMWRGAAEDAALSIRVEVLSNAELSPGAGHEVRGERVELAPHDSVRLSVNFPARLGPSPATLVYDDSGTTRLFAQAAGGPLLDAGGTPRGTTSLRGGALEVAFAGAVFISERHTKESVRLIMCEDGAVAKSLFGSPGEFDAKALPENCVSSSLFFFVFRPD